jgi:hypothetical protein
MNHHIGILRFDMSNYCNITEHKHHQPQKQFYELSIQIWSAQRANNCLVFTLCSGSVNMKPCFPMTLMCSIHRLYFAATVNGQFHTKCPTLNESLYWTAILDSWDPTCRIISIWWNINPINLKNMFMSYSFKSEMNKESRNVQYLRYALETFIWSHIFLWH